jgi:uncharacterized protein YbjT (DUF2867 family)
MYAIAGVTGHVGAVAAETLLAQGKQVRVIVRDAAKGAAWAKRGAEVVVATFGDAAALSSALTGVEGAFLLLPPAAAPAGSRAALDPLAESAAVSAALAAAIRAAKLPHVVLLSSIGAQHATGTGPIRGLHVAERDFSATGAAVTAVRPAYFQENWGSSLGALAQGVLPTFIPAAQRFAQVATADIGKAIAGALVEGGRGVQVIELAGPREYSANDVAAELAKLTGKPVVAQEAPLTAVVPTFATFGIPPASAELYREMYEGIANGQVDHEGGHRQVRGTTEIAVTLATLLAGAGQ